MPLYVLIGPTSLNFLLGIPSFVSAFVLVFPFAPSAIFLATFGGPAGALPIHEVHTLVPEMSLLPLKICCDVNFVTLIRRHKCARRQLQENEWDELKEMVWRDMTKDLIAWSCECPSAGGDGVE
ncbi:hypothetical protein Syun_002062 [Stephania yunnanensis]|uniref:Uncharacterized protein n=1 Tax=Stephania yunnanensis TaxID=152371 RepID=A0AAP0LGV9_9MAGN